MDSGTFNNFFNIFFQGFCSLVVRFSDMFHAWPGLVPPRVEAFYQTTTAREILTMDKLYEENSNFKMPLLCQICKVEDKSIYQLFVHCRFVRRLWVNAFVCRLKVMAGSFDMTFTS